MSRCDHSSSVQFKLAAAGLVAVLISACGGGGGGTDATVPTPTSWPSSGSYEVVLKPSGDTTSDTLQTSLSLVHSAAPDTEYQIDTAAAKTQLGLYLSQGNWNPAMRQFTDLQNTAYIDNRSGAVRVTALVANGARPAQSTAVAPNLCSTSQLASNFSKPFASQLVVDTAGTDGLCNTGDDGQMLVTFSTAGVPSVAAVPSQNKYLGYLRSPATGQPTHWLVAWKGAAQIDLWSIDQPGTSIIEAGSTTSATQFATVANLSDLILYTQNGLLKAMRMGNTPSISTPSELSSPSGWDLAGVDNANAYAYANSGSSSCSGTWRISSISRSAAVAQTLATGPGSLLGATTLNGAVYGSVCSGSTGSLIKVDTTTGVRTTLRGPSSTLYSATSMSGELAVTGISTIDGSWSLNFLGASGNLLYDAGAAIIFGANTSFYDASSNTFTGDSVYVVPQSLVATGIGGTLRRWDVASKAMHTVGTLPSATDLGGVAGNSVYPGIFSPSALIGGTYLARITSDNQIQSSGSRLYTFLPKTDNSLVLTTKQLR